LTKLRQGTVRDAWWLAVRARADVAEKCHWGGAKMFL